MPGAGGGPGGPRPFLHAAVLAILVLPALVAVPRRARETLAWLGPERRGVLSPERERRIAAADPHRRIGAALDRLVPSGATLPVVASSWAFERLRYEVWPRPLDRRHLPMQSLDAYRERIAGAGPTLLVNETGTLVPALLTAAVPRAGTSLHVLHADPPYWLVEPAGGEPSPREPSPREPSPREPSH